MNRLRDGRIWVRVTGLTPAILLIGVLGAATSLRADLIVHWATSDGGNGHAYEFVDFGANTSWTTARDYAAARCYLGSGGHLVTITSQAESEFLRSSFGSLIGDPGTNVP